MTDPAKVADPVSGPAPPLDTLRDNFAPTAHIPSDLVHESDIAEQRDPVVTIAVPTFPRPEMLLDTLASCVEQTYAGSVEIIVVDNDTGSEDWRRVVDQVEHRPNRVVRYYVNRENVGMFPNFNRCITLAQGTFLIIINDDDILAPDFLRGCLGNRI